MKGRNKFLLYPFADSAPITATLTTPAVSPVGVAFSVTATFSRPVTGLALGDITVTNGAASNLAGSGAVYTFDVTPTFAGPSGTTSVSIAAGVCADASGDMNTASNTLARTWTYAAYLDTLNLLVDYRFNEASGTIINHGLMGSALDATPTNVAQAQAGQLGAGEAVDLNGSTSTIIAPASVVIGGLTNIGMAFLLKADTAGEGNAGRIWGWGDSEASGHYLDIENALYTVQAQMKATGNAVSTTAPGFIVPGVWQWIFLNYDDTGDRKIHLYSILPGGAPFEATYTTQVAATGILAAMSGKPCVGSKESGGSVFDGLFDGLKLKISAFSTAVMTMLGALSNLSQAYAPVYGVRWDKTSVPTLTRTDASVGFTAQAGVDAGAVTNNFDTAEIFGEITEVTDGDGNVFVRIPKFYIEKTDAASFKSWRISKQSFGTAYLPWCFVASDGVTPLDYIDVGKYLATLSGDNKLESKPGKYPLINKNIVETRGYAQANGLGYQQLDIHVVDVLQTLFYVEFATLHSQSVMAGYTAGQYAAGHTATVAENNVNRIIVANATAALYAVGQAISVGTTLGGNQIFYGRTITSIDVVDASNKALVFDGAPVNIAIGNIVYNTGWLNDFSGWIAASSGSLVSNSTGKYPCMYRGIENPWGSLWQFVDGVNINERQAWVARDADDYASNLFAAPYEQLGYVNHNVDGYAAAMGYDAARPFAALPTAVGGGATAFYGDYYYQSVGQRIALLGGSWYSGSGAGLACWYLRNASSYAALDVGGRLLRKAL